MKKVALVLSVSIVLLTSCFDEIENSSQLVILPIESYTTPDSFTFGETDTIRVSYLLPNSCFSYQSIYYQADGSKRLVAINAVEQLDETCTQEVTQKEAEIVVRASQTEDYVFRFFKGVNSNGINDFEDVVIPVNQ